MEKCDTFSAGHKIEEVRVENHKYQYLYPEGDDFHFMNTETFEQISLNKNILDSPDLLKRRRKCYGKYQYGNGTSFCRYAAICGS
jgi:translation elongation factor P/translation initiation factor 5A